MLIYLHISFFVVILQRESLITNKMVATQPTFNQVYDLARMLPRDEQRQLLDKMVIYLFPEDNAYLQERRAHIAESERQIASGMVYRVEGDTIYIVDFFDTNKSIPSQRQYE